MILNLLGGNLMLNRAVTSLFVFFFISPFYFIGVSTQILSFIFFGGIFGLQLFFKSKVHLNKEILAIFYVLTVATLIIYFIHGQVNNYINVLFRFFTAFLICSYLFCSTKNLKEALTIIAASSLFHVIVILFQVLVPGFKTVWFSVVRNQADINLSENTIGELAIRSNGVSGFLYASDGVVFVLSALILSLFWSRFKVLKIIYIASSFICGRSSIFASLLYFWYLIRNSSFYRSLTIISFIIVTISASSFYIYINYPNFFDWIYEPIINLLKGEQISQSSSATFDSHFFIFDSEFRHYLGYGIFSTDYSEYYQHGLFPSDSGFMRIYTSGGVFQLVIYVGSVLLAYLRAYSSYRKRDFNNVSKFILILLIINLVFTIKSEFIYSNLNFLLLIILVMFKRRAIE
ncbi:hypothetical protein [Vibrio sp. 10N.239.312.D08]|uniref:hypothetical protein n=1 Tax=Vibrio sp. 10N.239.312.D08 TaxID=3229978 RepID=UPI0035538932